MENLLLQLNKYDLTQPEKEQGTCDHCGINTVGHEKYYNEKHCCNLCFYTQNIDLLFTPSKGKIILCYEISQQDIFDIQRVYWKLKDTVISDDIEHNEVIDTFEIVYKELERRSLQTDKLFSKGASDVDYFIEYLSKGNTNIDKNIAYLRWLPDRSCFESDIAYWNKTTFKDILPSNFETHLSKINKGEV